MSAEHHFTEPRSGSSIVTPHSYVIAFERGKPEIKPSHFGIGYSSLHQPTPEMAVEAYVRSCEREITDIREKILIVQELLPERIAAKIEADRPSAFEVEEQEWIDEGRPSAFGA